jgi:hypothetical protein
MKTLAIMSNLLYGGVKVEKNVPQGFEEAVLSSPAMKRFSMFYTGEVSSVMFQGPHNINKAEKGLLVHQVKPRNFLVRLYDLITGRKINRGFYYNSKQESDVAFNNQLGNLKKDTFTKLIAKHH